MARLRVTIDPCHCKNILNKSSSRTAHREQACYDITDKNMESIIKAFEEVKASLKDEVADYKADHLYDLAQGGRQRINSYRSEANRLFGIEVERFRRHWPDARRGPDGGWDFTEEDVEREKFFEGRWDLEDRRDEWMGRMGYEYY